MNALQLLQYNQQLDIISCSIIVYYLKKYFCTPLFLFSFFTILIITHSIIDHLGKSSLLNSSLDT